jgi:hypothetical protein
MLVAINLQSEVGQSVASRFATIDSLVHRSTWRIDKSIFGDYSIDKVRINESFYSSKPPLLPALGALVYFSWHLVTGESFATQLSSAVVTLNVFFGLVPWIAILLVFDRLLALTRCPEDPHRLALICFAFGFLGLGYSTEFNNHIPGALSLLGSFYLLKFYELGQGGSVQVAVSGALAGISASLDPSCLPFAVALATYTFLALERRTWLLFILALSIPLLISLFLVYSSTGSPVPIYARRDAYLFPGSYWSAPLGKDALADPKLLFLFHSILGHHGYLSMTPILFLGLYQHLQEAWCRGARSLDAWLLIGFLTSFLFVSLFRTNYGGICVGLRYLLIAMPIHFYYVSRWMAERDLKSKSRLVILVLLLVVSVLNAGNALAYPSQQSAWFRILESIGLAPSV